MHRAVALSILLVAPVTAFSFTEDPGQPRFGDRIDLQTDAQGGRFIVYAPADDADCLQAQYGTPVPADGTLRNLDLTGAGTWRIEHQSAAGTALDVKDLDVLPSPLSITAQPTDPDASDATAYQARVTHGNQFVPHAWLAVRLGGAPIGEPYRTDDEGLVTLPAEAFPYAGSYALVAYKDMDEPRTEYPRHIEHPPPDDCHHPAWTDPPELFGTGPASPIVRGQQGLRLDIEKGGVQVRGVDGQARIATTGPSGPVIADIVQLSVDGVPVDPGSIGLQVAAQTGLLVLDGSWDTPANVVVEARHDANGDGQAELAGAIQVAMRDDVPIRLSVEGDAIDYMVPPPRPDGRPGQITLRFNLTDTQTGRHATADDATVQAYGDLLQTARLQYDTSWTANITPRNGGGTLYLDVDWPGVASTTIVLETPPEGGARSHITHPIDELFVHHVDELRVAVQAYNRHRVEEGLCAPASDCAYDDANQAIVELRWADTGEALHNPMGHAYRYDPRPANNSVRCMCYQSGGEYVFYGLDVDRSGSLVAVIEVTANDGESAWSYAEATVRPQPVLHPQFTPDLALAGQSTTYELRAAGLSPASLADHHVRILDAHGNDVTTNGTLGTGPQGVTWRAALPAGEYSLLVEERLNPQQDLWGRNGTAEPGRLVVAPARVTFTYTEPAPPGTPGAELGQARDETKVLGGSLGGPVQVLVEVRDELQRPVPGLLRLDATHDDGIAGLFAYSDANEPPTVGLPYVFPPNELHWINALGRSYHLPELDVDREFAPVLEIPYTGEPVLIYAWGAGLGEATTAFQSGSSTRNTLQPGSGTVAFVPPVIHVENVTTRFGVAQGDALALGEANSVLAHVLDPTGIHDLAGFQFGLSGDVFGPTQAPGAQARSIDDRLRVGFSFTPDATGPMQWYASNPPSLIDADVTMHVLPRHEVAYVADGVEALYIDVPDRVQAGEWFQVRVATDTDAFPQGVRVHVFGANHTLVSGSKELRAPVVDAETDHPLVIEVPNHAAIKRILTVEPVPALLLPLHMEVPGEAEEGAEIHVAVTSDGEAVPDASVRLGNQEAVTDQNGTARLVVPPVHEDTVLALQVRKSGYGALEQNILVRDVARPQLVLDAARVWQGGEPQLVQVSARDELGRPAPLPGGTTLTIGVRHYVVPAGMNATVEHIAPTLIEDVPIYVIARAPGHDEARIMIHIAGVDA